MSRPWSAKLGVKSVTNSVAQPELFDTKSLPFMFVEGIIREGLIGDGGGGGDGSAPKL